MIKLFKNYIKESKNDNYTQNYINKLLDKISDNEFDSLTQEEKEILDKKNR